MFEFRLELHQVPALVRGHPAPVVPKTDHTTHVARRWLALEGHETAPFHRYGGRNVRIPGLHQTGRSWDKEVARATTPFSGWRGSTAELFHSRVTLDARPPKNQTL